MNFVFFGTPDYVVQIVDALFRQFRGKGNEQPVVAVVTQKPKPSGRDQRIEYSPVDTWAHKKKIPIFFDPTDLVKEKIHADIGVIAAYGAIIPNAVIKHFPKGIINVHPSLLPKWRGASPVQATVASGETTTGVTFFLIDELMDHGPILSSFKDTVKEDETGETLRNRLFQKSAEVLPGLVSAYLEGRVKPKPQDHDQATYTMLIKKEHGFVPWNILLSAMNGEPETAPLEVGFIKDCSLVPSAYSLNNLIRALSPWPSVWTEVKVTSNKEQMTRRLKILKSHLEPVQRLSGSTVKLILDLVQLEGKNPVSWQQFQEAYQI